MAISAEGLQNIEKGKKLAEERRDLPASTTYVEQGIKFVDQAKADAELARQQQIQQQAIAAGTAQAAPITEAGKAGVLPVSTVTPTPPAELTEQQKRLNLVNTYGQSEEGFGAPTNAQMAEYEKNKAELAKQQEVLSKQTAEITNKLLKFEEQQTAFSQKMSQIAADYTTNFQDYQTKLKNNLTESLKKEGKILDVNNPEFIKAINDLDKQAREAGISKNEEDYRRDFMTVAEQFITQPATEATKPEIPKIDVAGGLADQAAIDAAKTAKEDKYYADLGVTKTTEGGFDVKITDTFTLPVDKNGYIDFEKLINMDDVSLTAMEWALNVAQAKDIEKFYNDQGVADKQHMLDRQKAAQTYAELYKTKIAQEAERAKNRLTEQKILADQKERINQQIMEANKSAALSDIKDNQEKSFQYYKARLSAWGANDSTAGLAAVKNLEIAFSKELSGTAAKYDLNMQSFLIEQQIADSAYTFAIEDIEGKKETDLLDIDMKLQTNLDDINDAYYLSDKEKRAKIFDTKNNLKTKALEIVATAQKNRADQQKELRKYSLDLMMKQAEKSGYEYDIINGNVVFKKDDQGNKLLTQEGIKTQLEIQKLQTEADIKQSELAGVVMINGQKVTDDNGNLIPYYSDIKQTFTDDAGNVTILYKNGTTSVMSGVGKQTREGITYQTDAQGNIVALPTSQPAGGFRTDRHNNPAAFTVDIAKQAGLKEGVDYTTGDPFPNNPNLKTAKILGDPVDTTIKVIDRIGFYTQSGQPRWAYVQDLPGINNWSNLSYDQKKNIIAQMYAHEGGSGSLITGTPTGVQGKVKEPSKTEIDSNTLLQGLTKSADLLVKIKDKLSSAGLDISKNSNIAKIELNKAFKSQYGVPLSDSDMNILISKLLNIPYIKEAEPLSTIDQYLTPNY